MHHLITHGGRYTEDVPNHLGVEEQRQFVIAFVGGFFQKFFCFLSLILVFSCCERDDYQENNVVESFPFLEKMNQKIKTGH